MVYVLSGSLYGHVKDLLLLFFIRRFLTERIVLVCIGNYETSEAVLLKLKDCIFRFGMLVVHEAQNQYSDLEKHLVIGNPPSTKRVVKRANKTLIKGDRSLTVGFYSHLLKGKGFSKFVEFCSRMQSNNSIHAIVVGDCHDNDPNWYSAAQVQQTLERCSLASFQHEPNLDANVALELLSKSDFVYFATTYRHENLPLTVLDCMAYGIPIVLDEDCSLFNVLPEGTYARCSLLGTDKNMLLEDINNDLFKARKAASDWIEEEHSWRNFLNCWADIKTQILAP